MKTKFTGQSCISFISKLSLFSEILNSILLLFLYIPDLQTFFRIIKISKWSEISNFPNALQTRKGQLLEGVGQELIFLPLDISLIQPKKKKQQSLSNKIFSNIIAILNSLHQQNYPSPSSLN